MTNTEQTAAGHRRTRRRQAGRTAHMPGDAAMWVMVLGDFVFFGAYFIIFMIHRAMAPRAVPGSPSSTSISPSVW